MDRIESKVERQEKPVGNGRTATRFDLILDTVGRLLRRGAIGNLEHMVSKVKPEDSAEVKDLLRYEPKTAGAIMTTDFFSLPADTKAEEAIRRLQRATDTRNVFYVYVTDKDDKLVGVLSLRQLLLVPPDKTLGS